jgi:hypothetical protein
MLRCFVSTSGKTEQVFCDHACSCLRMFKIVSLLGFLNFCTGAGLHRSPLAPSKWRLMNKNSQRNMPKRLPSCCTHPEKRMWVCVLLPLYWQCHAIGSNAGRICCHPRDRSQIRPLSKWHANGWLQTKHPSTIH